MQNASGSNQPRHPLNKRNTLTRFALFPVKTNIKMEPELIHQIGIALTKLADAAFFFVVFYCLFNVLKMFKK